MHNSLKVSLLHECPGHVLIDLSRLHQSISTRYCVMTLSQKKFHLASMFVKIPIILCEFGAAKKFQVGAHVGKEVIKINGIFSATQPFRLKQHHQVMLMYKYEGYDVEERLSDIS